jgi:hypothetical protein
MVEDKEEKIEVLKFRKGLGTGKNKPHRGRKRREDKLKEQLMKYYGFSMEDN